MTATTRAPAVNDVFYDEDKWWLVMYRAKGGSIRYREIPWYEGWARAAVRWARAWLRLGP